MNNYWRQMYGESSRDFIKGVIAGITAFAVWENGKEYVGVQKDPLDEEIKKVKEGLGWVEGSNKSEDKNVS